MTYFLDMLKNFISSKYSTLLYVVLLVSNIFQGKLTSWYVIKKINKLLHSDYSIVDDSRNELIEEFKLKEHFMEFYNCRGKAAMYLVMGIASLGQSIVLFVTPNIDRISLNICMLTMTLSFIEFRDNRITSKKIKKELAMKTSKIIECSTDLDTMAREDSILDMLMKEKKITKEKRSEIIKKL